MSIYYNFFFVAIFIIILLGFIYILYNIEHVNKIHKFIFKLKHFLDLKKFQHYFYDVHKYENQILVSGKRYLKINDYLFKINKKKNSNIKKTKNLIIILFNKSSKYFRYTLGNKKFNRNISNNSINFIKIKSNNKKLKIESDKNNIILNTFYINKKTKKLVLILILDGMSNQLANNLTYSNSFFGKKNRLQNIWSNGPWTLPTFSSLFTGQYTTNHLNYKARSFYLNKRKIDEVQSINSQITMFEFFKKKGFVTSCYSPYARVNPSYNFDRGVDIFKNLKDSSTDEIVDEVISQIELFDNNSNLIFAHLMDAHHRIKGYDRLSDFIFFPDDNYNYLNLNQDTQKKTNKTQLDNEKLKNFLRIKNFYEEKEIINRMKLVDLRLSALYHYINKQNFEDFTIILMGDHGTRLKNSSITGNVLDKAHQNVGFFIKDKKNKSFKNKKNSYIATIDILPSLISRYENKNSKKTSMYFNGQNTIFSSQKKNFVVCENLYDENYDLLINYKENYLHSAFSVENGRLISEKNSKFYDKNEKEVKTKNKNFPFKILEEIRKNHLRKIKLKG